MIGARKGWPEVAGGWENPALPATLADDFMVTIYFDCLMSGYGDQLRVLGGFHVLSITSIGTGLCAFIS